MRILVTGGAGYIGCHTVRRLLQSGHTVTVFDNLSMGHRAAVPAELLVVGDLKDVDHLDHVLVVNRIEAVIHFAASAYVGESVTNPAKYYQNNLLNSVNLIERCRRLKISRFIFSSTCATYGVPETLPITEATPQKPINPYGQTKLAIERMLADYADPYGLGSVSLRYFNAAGAAADGRLGEQHDPETHLIPLVLQVAAGKRPEIEIFGDDYPTPDGTCIRDYVHVEDLAAAHALALEHLTPGQAKAYNVGTGRGFSVREVIQTAVEVTGQPIRVKVGPRRAGDPPKLVAQASLIQRELGWQPQYTELKPIIQTAWNWMTKNPDGYASRA